MSGVEGVSAVGLDHPSLRDRVLTTLREMIVTGALGPGDRLHERNLSAELAVSRVPLREALIQLANEGFVDVVPRRGAFVSSVTESSVSELFDIREALESMAAGLAAERRTRADLDSMRRYIAKEKLTAGQAAVSADSGFHRALLRAAHHTMLSSLMGPIEGHVQRLFHLTTGRLNIAMADDHDQILKAIRAQDREAASCVAAEHVRSVRQATMAYLSDADRS